MSEGGAGPRRTLVEGWLGALFWLAAHAPWALRACRPAVVAGAWAFAPGMRRSTLENAAHLLGPGSTARERGALARGVVGNFFDAVVEFGGNRRVPVEALLGRLEAVDGEGRYTEARGRGKGAILATAHLGPFETAMAMVVQREGVGRGGAGGVHVVFKRDPSARFERLRSEQHARLGVSEAPVDDGLATWFKLRDALRDDGVVLMQADRVMPGQPGVEVPFFDGVVRLPSGPVKLARMTGAPIIPVFSLGTASGGVRIVIEEPIWAEELGAWTTGPDPALLRLAGALERRVREHPEQWLCLHRVWCNDAPRVMGMTPAATP